jgi:hypothetical protein
MRPQQDSTKSRTPRRDGGIKKGRPTELRAAGESFERRRFVCDVFSSGPANGDGGRADRGGWYAVSPWRKSNEWLESSPAVTAGSRSRDGHVAMAVAPRVEASQSRPAVVGTAVRCHVYIPSSPPRTPHNSQTWGSCSLAMSADRACRMRSETKPPSVNKRESKSGPRLVGSFV